jgi:hypothetical protein
MVATSLRCLELQVLVPPGFVPYGRTGVVLALVTVDLSEALPGKGKEIAQAN